MAGWQPVQAVGNVTTVVKCLYSALVVCFSWKIVFLVFSINFYFKFARTPVTKRVRCFLEEFVWSSLGNEDKKINENT